MIRVAAFLCLSVGVSSFAWSQDLLPTMPRYDRYEKMRREISGSVKRGEVTPTWAADGSAFSYSWDGKTMVFDLKTLKASEGTLATSAPSPVGTRARGGQRRGPERGRQFGEVFAEDGKKRAFFKDQNVWLSDTDGKNESQLTTEGSKESRIKFGQASWVYGEELNVREAMWFSPDSTKLAYYRFDESKVPDYYLALDQAKIQSSLDIEAYPKAGAPNPGVALYVYDFATKKSVQVDTGDQAPSSVGHYVYQVRWSPDGKELLFHRTDRKQRTMQFCAADPVSGSVRVVVEERQPNSWTDNAPEIRWLEDNRRFIWASERNGYKNYYLGNLDGSPLKPITQHIFEVENIVRIDEKLGLLWYRAHSAPNPYLVQFHRCRLDGTNDKRLTNVERSHTVNLSPDGKFFTAVQQTYENPPITTIHRADDGTSVGLLAASDMTKFTELGLKPAERVVFKAADGVTDCYGYIKKPSDFDPNKKYPLIVGMYAGPDSGTSEERFQMPDPICEFGFITAWFDGRGTQSRGKAFKDAVYGKLGVVEIDDQAAGVKELVKRPYVDGKRVGAHGTSYGGYSSLMCLLRHPDVFAAACSSSPVTDWRNYDTIYTERYMGLPDEGENKAGYDEGSAMKYVRNLKGRLMLFYGTADNNVHPSNTLQLSQALMRAGKNFDMMVGTDMGHSGINGSRMWEYFLDNLILRHRPDTLAWAHGEWKKRR